MERRNTIGIEGIGEVNWQLGDVGRNQRLVLREQLGLNVRFTPESGHDADLTRCLVFDPYRKSSRATSPMPR